MLLLMSMLRMCLMLMCLMRLRSLRLRVLLLPAALPLPAALLLPLPTCPPPPCPSPTPRADSIVKPYIMGKEARGGDKPQTLADMLPDWVGYGALYGVSAIPVMLAVSAILVLFYNSLK
jgi:hypothetical protein